MITQVHVTQIVKWKWRLHWACLFLSGNADWMSPWANPQFGEVVPKNRLYVLK